MARSLLGRPVIQAQSACLSLSPITPSFSVCIPASPGHHQNSLLGGAHALPPQSLFVPAPPPLPQHSLSFRGLAQVAFSRLPPCLPFGMESAIL